MSYGLQLDVGGLPSTVLSAKTLTSALLTAMSSDNVNPQAVLQMRALGACFHSNGPVAAKLPDILSRCTSVRLERLSAWIGWAKGDTPSYMSQTSGGRT